MDLLGSVASSSEAASSTEASGIISGERRGRWGARWATAAASPSCSARSAPRSRRGYLLHPLHKVWAKPFPVRFASWNAPSILVLDIQSPEVMLSGTLSGGILVRKLACPKVGMSGNLYPRRGLQPVFWIRRLTNASSASSPVREFVFLQIPVRMPEDFHVRLLRRGIPCVWGSVVREFIRSGWLEYTTDI